MYWEDWRTPKAGLSEGFGWLIDDRMEDAAAVVSIDQEVYKDNLAHYQIFQGWDKIGCDLP